MLQETFRINNNKLWRRDYAKRTQCVQNVKAGDLVGDGGGQRTWRSAALPLTMAKIPLKAFVLKSTNEFTMPINTKLCQNSNGKLKMLKLDDSLGRGGS